MKPFWQLSRIISLGWIATVHQVSSAVIIDTDWFANATTVSNVVEFGGTDSGELRLSGNANNGSISGTVSLPSNGDWILEFSIRTDEGTPEPDGYIDVFLNGSFEGRFNNTPSMTTFPISRAFSGEELTFNIQLFSPNLAFTRRPVVEAGTITAVPEPEAWVLIVMALYGTTSRRRRS